MTKAEIICILHVSIPADVEYELLSAAFDPVLSLHVCHELCAVTVDSQNGVPWTQVTLGGLAAWCYLKVTFTRTYTHTHTHTSACVHKIQAKPREKPREKNVISGVKLLEMLKYKKRRTKKEH